jgi:HlyD family secretion protein
MDAPTKPRPPKREQLPIFPHPSWLARLQPLARSPIVQRLSKLRLAHWIWIGAAGALMLFFVWMLWPRAQEVEVAVIDRGLVRREAVDEGRTRIHDVFVIAAPVAGALQRIELEPGDPVSRGQVVATIAPAHPALLDARIASEARAGVAAAQAALRGAEAELDLALQDQRRVAVLHARGFAAPAARDRASAAVRAARSNVSARRAELERARVASGFSGEGAQAPTHVRSPASGRVLRLLQESEATIGPGAPLFEIGDPSDLEVVAEFLSQDAILMRPGAAAFIESWGGETPIPARVSRIEPYARTKISALGVEEQRVNVIARLRAPREAPPLGHGFRVDLRVVVSEQANVLRVPTDALVRNGGDWAVFRIESGRVRLRRIALGDGGERNRAVLAGLSEGDRVVLFPGDALEDGDRVRAAR